MTFSSLNAKFTHRLDALCELEIHANSALKLPGVPTLGIQFATPSGTLYEADCLSWKYYHFLSSNVAHAINNKAYGPDVAQKLSAAFFGGVERPVSADEVKTALGALRMELGAK